MWRLGCRPVRLGPGPMGPDRQAERPFEMSPRGCTIGVEVAMYRRILLAVDAQRVADAAVRAVAQLAASRDAEVMAVHVRDTERGLRTRFEDQHLVEHVVARLRDAGVTARGEVRTISNGDVADTLLDSAERFGADVIALGSHGRSELGGLLLGTVGQRIAARTDRPVMLVRGDPTRPSHRWPARIDRILLAVDRNEQRERAIQAARELAREHRAAVVVQYVDPVFESVSSAQRFVRGIVGRLRTDGVVTWSAGLAGMGDVASQIAAAAERIDADVIVVGSRRRRDLAALVLGSVTRDLVRRTTRPVLLADTSEHRETDGATPAADTEGAPTRSAVGGPPTEVS
jgi:nucleotide-binding universal stress UspA family protein